jgi:glycosyltransferase involved in cell wall biosynthesis
MPGSMSPLRIFVTGHNCRTGGGISVARNLIKSFGSIAPQHRYHFTIPDNLGFEECCAECPQASFTVYNHKRGGLPKRVLWEKEILPRIARGFEPDVIFNIANRSMVGAPAPQATMINDAHLFCDPRQWGKTLLKERAIFTYHRNHLQWSLSHTDSWFCQTELAAEGMQRKYGKDLRIQVCQNCISTFLDDDKSPAPMPEPISGCKRRFKLFCLAMYYSHKNLDVLINLFTEQREMLRDVAVIITIAPGQHPGARKLIERIGKLGLDDAIINVGPLQQSELRSYYQHTDAVFLPTLLESSSATYLEAMHYGRPILTSDLDFARAACGDAALYFDPWHTRSIAEAIVTLVHDHALRERLTENGSNYKMAGSYTWDDAATIVLRELERIATPPSADRGVK